jgi:hypothetical protein
MQTLLIGQVLTTHTVNTLTHYHLSRVLNGPIITVNYSTKEELP